jgi:hypothetical protein
MVPKRRAISDCRAQAVRAADMRRSPVVVWTLFNAALYRRPKALAVHFFHSALSLTFGK